MADADVVLHRDEDDKPDGEESEEVACEDDQLAHDCHVNDGYFQGIPQPADEEGHQEATVREGASRQVDAAGGSAQRLAGEDAEGEDVADDAQDDDRRHGDDVHPSQDLNDERWLLDERVGVVPCGGVDEVVDVDRSVTPAYVTVAVVVGVGG